MVLQFPNDICALRRENSGSTNDRNNFNRSVQDRLMTDNVVQFPKDSGLDDYFGVMHAYDLELTNLSTKALDLGLDVHTIVGLLHAQAQFLLDLELYEDDQ
jgi:hypothetical protein